MESDDPKNLVLVHLEHKVGDIYEAVVGTADDSAHWEMMLTTHLHDDKLEWGIMLAVQERDGVVQQIRGGLDWLREAVTPMLGRALARCEMERLEADYG